MALAVDVCLMRLSQSLDKSFLTLIACLPNDVIFRILSFCGIKDLLVLNSTCWLTRVLVKFYIRHVWSFDLRFRVWFHDVRGFQRLLRLHRAVVSGSLAVQFFDRVYYPEGTLDIYVYHTNIRYIAEWMASEGYILAYGNIRPDIKKCLRTKSIEPYRENLNGTSITVVLNYYKHEVFWDSTPHTRRIQIIGVECHPVRHILQEFHTSKSCDYQKSVIIDFGAFDTAGVVNFITATVAVSVFPKPTFVDRKLALLRDLLCPQSHRFIQKYKDRGFEVMCDTESSKVLEDICGRNRSVLDSVSWKIRFHGKFLSSGQTFCCDQY